MSHSDPICGATWPEDTTLVCLRPAGHRGGHRYDEPPPGDDPISARDGELHYIRQRLAETYTAEGVEVWLNGHNRQLGGERAIDLIERGDGDQVLAVIARLEDGAFS